MTLYAASERRRRRTGKSRRGGALLVATAMPFMMVPGIGAGQTFNTGPMVYGPPKAQTVKAKQSDINTVDAQAQALADQLRAGSPTAVEYAERAHGALILPDIQTESRLVLGPG
jgi:hypothetical protein